MLRRAVFSSLRCASHRATARSLRAIASASHLCKDIRVRVTSRQSPLQVAHFSSDTAVSPPHMTEHEFMELADETLHDIQSWLDGIEEMLEESDVIFSQGVLKIDLGEHGTWVINRQVPNRQIWWSSPISGPRRYEYDASNGHWVNTRDKGELMELLRSEILDATGIEIYS